MALESCLQSLNESCLQPMRLESKLYLLCTNYFYGLISGRDPHKAQLNTRQYSLCEDRSAVTSGEEGRGSVPPQDIELKSKVVVSSGVLLMGLGSFTPRPRDEEGDFTKLCRFGLALPHGLLPSA